MTKLCSKRYEELKREAVKLAKRSHINQFPINPFLIAENMGIEIRKYSTHNEEEIKLLRKCSQLGFCVIDESHSIIYYNDQTSEGCINNTIMHEIAHIILGHNQESEFAEAEAKFLAKYLLAPPVIIHKLGLNNEIELMETFNISYEAAYYALEYYKKWFKHYEQTKKYKPYEIELLNIFGFDL